MENNNLWYLLGPFVQAFFTFAEPKDLEELKRYAELAGTEKPQELQDKKPIS